MLSKEYLSHDWRSREYVVVDLEGTGAQHKEKEGIVDFAAVLIRNGSLAVERIHYLLNPGISIPPFISRIHGMYDKDVKDRPMFEEVKAQIQDFLDDRILVAHNAPVERRVLKYKLPTYQPPMILDTLRMARALYGATEKYSLDQLIAKLDLEFLLMHQEIQSKRHGALYDSIATAYVFSRMVQDHFPENCPLEDIAEKGALDWHSDSDTSPETSKRQSSLPFS